jgi:hypothetical protein
MSVGTDDYYQRQADAEAARNPFKRGDQVLYKSRRPDSLKVVYTVSQVGSRESQGHLFLEGYPTPYWAYEFEAFINEPTVPRRYVQPGELGPGRKPMDQTSAPLVRSFDTGATRSGDAGRYDPEGFLSPLSIERYSLYMAANQKQPDGSFRSSDNWQKGLPLATYMKGMWRHMLHLWTRYRGYPVQDPKAAANIEEDLCAILFNVQGMLHETVKARLAKEADAS